MMGSFNFIFADNCLLNMQRSTKCRGEDEFHFGKLAETCQQTLFSQRRQINTLSQRVDYSFNQLISDIAIDGHAIGIFCAEDRLPYIITFTAKRQGSFGLQSRRVFSKFPLSIVKSWRRFIRTAT